MHRKQIILAAIEIKRRYSCAGAVDVADQCDYQRQRKPGHDWLDWEVLFLRSLDGMTTIERHSLLACYYPPQGWQWKRRNMEAASRAIDKLWHSVNDELIKYGRRIARFI